MKRLSEIAELTVGYVGTMGKEYSKQGITFLRSLNVKPFSFDLSDIKYIPRIFNEKIKKSELHTDDVVIVRTGIPGTSAVIPKELEGCNCADLVIVRPNKDIVDPYYLCAFINSWGKAQVSNVKVGAIQKHFNVSSAEEMLIPILDINTQKAISLLLKNINEKIFNNTALCSTLESMAKLLYDYWFVQFDFPDENGRPYKSSGGKMVWNEELKREIPKGWEVKYASDLTMVRTGKEDANFASNDGKFAYFTCGKDVLKCNVPAFEGRAVLLAGNGDFNVKHFTGKFNAYQRTYVLIPNDEKYYALLYMVTKEAIERFTKGSAGSIVKFITLGDVNGIILLDPHDDIMLEKFNLIIDKIEQIQAENQQLASLRDFLLPMLMNGQVKVGKGES